jgi:glycosyltransferase involved in cell wall biosynthesis
MNDLKITIVSVTHKEFKASAQSTCITFEELRGWIRRGVFFKHLFRYEEAGLLTERMEVIPKPFFVALLLLSMSPKAAYFKNGQGRHEIITIRVLEKLFWQLIRDVCRKPGLLRRTQMEVEHLSNEVFRQQPKNKLLDLSGIPVYLRTDLTFGLRSGGSLGHIAGILNHLDEFTERPIFLSTDVIPTVRNDLETYIIIPRREFWDLKELPSIYFNKIFEQTAQKYLNGKRLSFIYQRYSVNNYSGLKLARFYGVPFVLEYNGSEIWIQQHWGKPLKYAEISERVELLNLRAADIIVVVSQPMRDELIGRGIKAEKILVNPNGVDPNRYSPDVDGSGVRHQYYLTGNTVIGFIGTFGKWHGAEVLAEAFGKLLHKHPEYQRGVKLFMIGDGITMPLVKENINKFDIIERCVLTGLVPQEKGPEYLAACDVLVASHKPNLDGTPFFGSPTKLFEYMAMGKGIVASDLDQIGEVLKHDHTAWLVKPGDIESLMLGLKSLIDDEERRVRLGKAARQEVVTKYTWKEHTRKIIEKLKERCGR